MTKKKVVVFVRHYLTPEGINYFDNQWFPSVEAIISQQQGFISITHSVSPDAVDCKVICLIFEDETTLNRWAAQPNHDALIDALEGYRSRNYWEAVRTEDEHVDLSSLDWTTYQPRI